MVQVAAGHGEPTYLLVLQRPVEGRLRVREWTDENWSGDPIERTVPTHEIYDRVEHAFRQRRRISVDMELLRDCLAGRAV